MCYDCEYRSDSTGNGETFLLETENLDLQYFLQINGRNKFLHNSRNDFTSDT